RRAKTGPRGRGSGRSASSTTVTVSEASRSGVFGGTSGAGAQGRSGRRRTSRSVTTKKRQTRAASRAMTRLVAGGRSDTSRVSCTPSRPWGHHDRVSHPAGFEYAAPMRSPSVLAMLAGAAILLGSNLVANADPPKGKEIRRDEQNRKGISPYMELLVKGDAAFVARDLLGAISTYQEAIKLRSEEMMALYRLGEAE